MICAIILTYNEEIHIRRCIENIKQLTNEIYVIDSYSTDDTVNIAVDCGAICLQRAWDNHASQFNWALSNIHSQSKWIFRVDADEIVSKELSYHLRNNLHSYPDEVRGIFVKRRIFFLEKLVRFGGVGSVHVMRIFRKGCGYAENRIMDEHIVINGDAVKISGYLDDVNLNGLTYWIDKHNRYASLEAYEYFKNKLPPNSSTIYHLNGAPKIKRFIKTNLYYVFPPGFRSLLYFIYRFFIRFGFLDRGCARQFHFLQAFWYRYLVDCKILEVENYSSKSSLPIRDVISHVLRV